MLDFLPFFKKRARTLAPKSLVTDPARRRNERGTILLLGTCALVFVVPLTGLAVDVGYLYACKSRLQAAVDGAALAAARALNLGSNISAQQVSATKNAKNWFYSNFPAGNWGTVGPADLVSPTDILVQEDPDNAQLQTVTVTASTRVPTYFMRWFNFNSTLIQALGKATRRDVVVMIVLDRSSSMTGPACTDLKLAANLFTGQFQAGRDRIGLLSFSDGTYLHSSPTTNFQNILGYQNDLGSHSGEIDDVVCQGGTNTAQAISIAYNEIRKINLPRAYNILLFESDGLPNTLTMRFGTNVVSGNNLTYTGAFASTASVATNVGGGANTGCKDNSGRQKSSNSAAWTSTTTISPFVHSAEKDWLAAKNFNTPASGGNPAVTSFLPAVGAGAYGALYVIDANPGTTPFLALGNPWHPNSDYGLGSDHMTTTTTTTPNCLFNVANNVTASARIKDFDWLPPTDVFGNMLNPSASRYPYKSVTMDPTVSTRVRFRQNDAETSSSGFNKRTNFINGAFNAADYAAYNARTDATIPATVFVIGLGGSTTPPDKLFMQRIANDPGGSALPTTDDDYYAPCTHLNSASTGQCIYYDAQPQGQFIYAPTRAELGDAFVQLASQILRLSR